MSLVLPDPLRDYQREDIEFLVQHRRAYLANEPGLGKTVEALVALERLGARRVLVVGNKPSLGVWQDEARRWLGTEALIYGGSPYQRKRIWEHYLATKPQFLVVNYSLAREVVEKRNRWEAIVCDEIHRGGLLNRKTQGFGVVNSVISDAMILMTGTPIREGPHDLWGPLHLIDRKTFRSYWKFVEEHCIRTRVGFNITIEARPKDPLALKELLSNYLIRRRKRDVLKELPPKQRQSIKLELSPTQKRIYEQLEKEMLIDTQELPDVSERDLLLLAPTKATAILRMRQLLVTPQLLGLNDPGSGLEALPELVEEEFAAGRSVAICTPFKLAVSLISKVMRKVTPNVYQIHGDLTAEQVRATSKAFQQLKTVRKVIIYTIKSGTSFDAYEASTCFFLGAEWSAVENLQAEDRLDRLGQKKGVMCYYILFPNTIDDAIIEKLNHKQLAESWVLRPQGVLNSYKKIFKSG